MIEISEFAELILFGNDLQSKLTTPLDGLFTDIKRKNSLQTIPDFPGRSSGLAKFGRHDFPNEEKLKQTSERGILLHFFANHELLAMELMALMLLRFPDAPESFRLGIAQTIVEEQNHLRLYVERMNELGVALGDIPVNRYFWDAMKDMRSPLEFVTQMSLTLEQANLDFSLFYKNLVAKIDDQKTSEILERVYREEIGHVKHGWIWFNRLRENAETESAWNAYKRILPAPMNPMRAKGQIFDIEGRKLAGIDENFIESLRLHSGSKGRPPSLFLYAPDAESTNSRSDSGFTESAIQKKIRLDLETLSMFFAKNTDIVLVEKEPSLEWRAQLKNSGFELPEFNTIEELKHRKFAGFEPWGWSHKTFDFFKKLLEKKTAELVPASASNHEFCKKIFTKNSFNETGLAPLFSKSFSAAADDIFENIESAETRIESLFQKEKQIMVKAPFGTSGNQVRRLRNRQDYDESFKKWITNTIANQKSIIIETYLDRVVDLSTQVYIHKDSIDIIGTRQFLVDNQFAYKGTILSAKLAGLDQECIRFFHQENKNYLQEIKNAAVKLQTQGYEGPAGIDSFIYRKDGKLEFRAIVEINPRYTMGRVAIEVEKYISPSALSSSLAKFSLVSIDEAQKLKAETVLDTNGRIKSGLVFLTDISSAKHFVACLTVATSAPY